MRRLLDEALAEQQSLPSGAAGEPLFDLIHGIPGAGKSRLIGWLCEVFEILGWTHGVQFVCLAYQNTMAALINGATIHHWSGIPVGDAEGTAGTRDNHRLSTR